MLEKGNNVVQDKSYKFALRIIKLYQFLYNKKKEFVLSKQVLRSGTAVGALIEEGIHAESNLILFIKSILHIKKQRKLIIG